MERGVMRIKEFSDKTGFSADTLRYYEKIGLIAPPLRDSAGHRVYSQTDLVRAEFLHRLRSTGMPIAGMLDYARLRAEGDATAEARHDLLAIHREAVRAQVADLQETLSVLDTKLALYAAMMSDAKGQDDDNRNQTGTRQAAAK